MDAATDIAGKLTMFQVKNVFQSAFFATTQILGRAVADTTRNIFGRTKGTK